MTERVCEFSLSTKKLAFERAGGCCELCNVLLDFSDVEFHHIQPLYFGGDCSLENCMVLCYNCHRGDEESFKRLHPASPPRQVFLGGRGRVRRTAIVKARSKNR